MASRGNRKPSRQVKTLAALVVSMTFGTFLLSWIHDVSPSAATTLRSVPAVRHTWERIIVQSRGPGELNSDGLPRSFYHLFVDRSGRLHESSAWRGERPDPHTRGAIRIAVGLPRGSVELSSAQWDRLRDLLTTLKTRYHIPAKSITLDRTTASAARDRDMSRKLSALIKKR